MYDASTRLRSRRGCDVAVDQDAMHMMGYRHCALEAVRYLTERANFDPDSAVVRRIRGLLDGPGSEQVPDVVAECAADVGRCRSETGNVGRVRRTSQRAENAENHRSMSTSRCLYGRVSRRQRHHRRRSRRLPADVSSPNSAECVGRSSETPGSEAGRRCPLRTLQATPTSSRSTSTDTDGVQCRQDDDQTTDSDVLDCASLLIRLSQSDHRVRNVLDELLQLMDIE